VETPAHKIFLISDVRNILTLLMLLPLVAHAQLTSEEQAQVDSLKKVIANAKNDTSIVAAWMAWDRIIYYSDLELDAELNRKMDSLSSLNLKKKLHPKEREAFIRAKAFAIGSFGITAQENGDYPKAIAYHNQSLQLNKEIVNLKGVAAALGNLGNIYNEQGKIPLALENFSQAYKIYEKLNDPYGMGGSLNNMGMIYQYQGDFKKGIEQYQLAYEAYKIAEDKKGEALALANVGEIYFEEKNYPKASEYYSRSLDVSQKSENQRGMAIALLYLGKLNVKTEKTDSAEVYTTQSMKLFEEIGDLYGLAVAHIQLLEIQEQLGKGNNSLELAKKSIQLAQQIGANALIEDAAYINYKLLKEKGQYRDALAMHELYKSSGDSLRKDANDRETFRLLYKREYEMQASADSLRTLEEKKLKDAEIAKQQAELRAQKNQQYMLFGGLILVIAFAGFMYNRFKITQKQNRIIEEQKLIVEEKNKEILDSINYAKRIQAAILPPSRVVKQHLPDSFVLYKPKDIVAGDFYWMHHHAGANVVLFAAADCTGHGVPGALVSVVCNNGLNRAVREYGLLQPSSILDKTRDIVIAEFEKSEEEVKDGMDISLCALQGKQLQWSGANNPLWIVRKGREGAELIEIRPDKQPIGKFSEAKPFTNHKVDLQSGDLIYIFTDGYSDQFGGDDKSSVNGKKFKAANFKKLLLSLNHLSMEEQLNHIDQAFESWRGSFEQIDDVCVIGVKVA
jgi:serine phosphatase RsbU (regulator of sigma subunit)